MKTSLITSIQELAELEPRWEALRRECGGTLFASHYLTRTWFQAYARIASPRVIAIEDGSDLVGIAPLTSYSYHVSRLPVRVLALAGEMKDRLRLSTTSLMLAPGRPEVLPLMVRQIKGMDWNLLTTINLEDNEANRSYIDMVRSTWRTEEFPPARKMTLDLPGSGSIVDTLDKKTRKNLSYRERLLERDGHRVEYRTVPSGDIGRAVDLYARQHIERWEARGGSYFRDPENVEFMKMCAQASEREGRGHIYEVLIDGEVAAQDFYMIDGTIAYGDKTGMSDQFMRYSPGWLVQVFALDDLRDRGMRSCVMGIGGEKYKTEMGGVESPLLGIRATRGRASFLSWMGGTAMGRFIDGRLGVSSRSLGVQE